MGQLNEKSGRGEVDMEVNWVKQKEKANSKNGR